MRGSFVRRTLLCASLVIFSAAANATPLTWTLYARAPTLIPSGFLFAPPIFGTFTYDADVDISEMEPAVSRPFEGAAISSWYIHQCINIDCNTLAHSPGPGFPGSFALVSNGGTFLFFAPGGVSGAYGVRLEIGAPLTDAGGIIPLIPGSPDRAPGWSVGDGSAAWQVLAPGVPGAYYPFASGTVAAAPAAVPEPGSGLCTILFVLAFAAIRYKRWRAGYLFR